MSLPRLAAVGLLLSLLAISLDGEPAPGRKVDRRRRLAGGLLPGFPRRGRRAVPPPCCSGDPGTLVPVGMRTTRIEVHKTIKFSETQKKKQVIRRTYMPRQPRPPPPNYGGGFPNAIVTVFVPPGRQPKRCPSRLQKDSGKMKV